MVSDGMSFGTLVMSDLYLKRKFGRPSNWMGLYEQNLAQRAVMDMASASSVVTDSSAASSSWGGGVRVKNGSLNISPDGKEKYAYLTKVQKSRQESRLCYYRNGKPRHPLLDSVLGAKSRNAMDEIALNYTELGFDVMLGGGSKYFDPAHRKDKKEPLCCSQKERLYSSSHTQ